MSRRCKTVLSAHSQYTLSVQPQLFWLNSAQQPQILKGPAAIAMAERPEEDVPPPAFGWAGLAADLLSDDSHDSQVDPAQPLAIEEGPQEEVRAATPPKPELDEVELAALPQPISTPMSEPLFLPALGGVCARFEQAGQMSPDPVIQKLGEHFLQQPNRLHTTKQALGRLLDVDPKAIESSLSTLASSLLHLDKMERFLLEKSLANLPTLLLAYFDVNKFDETPMRVSQQQDLEKLASQALQPPAATQLHPDPSTLRPLSEHNPFQVKAATPAKLFATSQQFAYLIRIPEEVQTHAGRQHLLLRGSSLTALQVLESATGSHLKQALLENNGVSDFSKHFFTKTRITTTDMAGANVVAEKCVLADRDEEWGHFHNFCNVHVVSRSISRSLEFFSKDVTGMIHCSLALSVGSALERFRKSLATVLAQKIMVTPGSSSVEAARHRDFVLELFCTTGSKVAMKQYLLKKLPNGDWRDRAKVEVFVTPGVEYDENDIKEKVVSGLLLVLSGKLFRTFPRHRWLGADNATDEIGLCEAVHGLASQAFAHMMQQPRSSGSSSTQGPSSSGSLPAPLPTQVEVAEPITSGPAGTDTTPDMLEGDAGEFASRIPAGLLPQASGEMSAAQILAGENERHRKVAMGWLQDNPLSRLMALRLCIGPLTDLISSYVNQSGQRWETQERATQAASLSGGEDTQRRYHLLEYINLNAERAFFDRLEGLRQDSNWKELPSQSWTMDFQCQIFRTLSRMGAAIEELLVEPTRKCPFTVLRLLTDPDHTSSDLLHTPACCLDNLTTKHLQKFPGSELTGADSLAVLEALCVVGSTETVGLEWGHGRVNRLITATSNQSKRPSLEFIGAQWLCQKHKQRHSTTCAALKASLPSRPARAIRQRRREPAS